MQWIHEKMQVATDDSYQDPTNLQSKIKKHQAFVAEFGANKRRVDAVNYVSMSKAQFILKKIWQSLIMIYDHPWNF